MARFFVGAVRTAPGPCANKKAGPGSERKDARDNPDGKAPGTAREPSKA